MLMFWWDVRASGDTESTHTTYTVWVVLLDCSFYWIPNIRICKCPFLYGCSIYVQILFGGGINVACTWATSILTDLFMYHKMRQKFKTKSNKINKIKKKLFCPFRGMHLFRLCVFESLCCIYNPSSSAEVTRSSGIHCLLHVWGMALFPLSLSALFAGKIRIRKDFCACPWPSLSFQVN